MGLPDKIKRIIEDRESGSVALLNRLITALEHELKRPDFTVKSFSPMITEIRKKLCHFAAIENFLSSLLIHWDLPAGKGDPGQTLTFISEYREYWHDSMAKITRNFLHHFDPEGKTLLTHSHSQTIISLLEKLHQRQITFRVLQTVSIPGEEGRIACERLRQLNIEAEITDDARVGEVLQRTHLVLMGCDALLPEEFLNKTGTRTILEKAKALHIPSCLVTESRKKINRPDWKTHLGPQPLFEWIPLDLADRILCE